MSTGDPKIFSQGLVGGNGISISSQPYWTSINIDLKSNTEFRDLQSRIAAIEKRLLILKPNEALQAKYPALQEAYDAYKIIEAIVNNETSK